MATTPDPSQKELRPIYAGAAAADLRRLKADMTEALLACTYTALSGYHPKHAYLSVYSV